MSTPPVAAAIDIGSNTVHMLAGSVRDGRIEPIDEASDLVGLGEDVYAGKPISPARIEQAAEAVSRLATRARDRGADPILLVATAAVRDAPNADALARLVRERSGLDMQTIDGTREADLTYRGAAAGVEALSLQVCDVGGGSTEVICATRNRIVQRQSLPLGSSRLSQRLSGDPPSLAQVDALQVEAAAVLATMSPCQPQRLIITGGTASALARVIGNESRTSEITVDALERARSLLLSLPSSEVAARHGIDAKRARLLPAGAAIVAAIVATTAVTTIVLTGAGLRDGLLLEHAEGLNHP